MLNTTLGSACGLMWAYRIINQPMVLNLMSLKNDFEVWRELQVQDCHIALCAMQVPSTVVRLNNLLKHA
jgi:hypothetical protein